MQTLLTKKNRTLMKQVAEMEKTQIKREKQVILKAL
jgi:hypothetical protein